MSIFSERIKMLQDTNNVYKKDIANAIGVNVRTYQYYESGQREPTLSVLISLANFFNVSIDYLSGRTDNPNIINNCKNDSNEQKFLKEEAELVEDFMLLDKYEKNIIRGRISELIYNKQIEEANNIESQEIKFNVNLSEKVNK